jgi:hypothetical protein
LVSALRHLRYSDHTRRQIDSRSFQEFVLLAGVVLVLCQRWSSHDFAIFSTLHHLPRKRAPTA